MSGAAPDMDRPSGAGSSFSVSQESFASLQSIFSDPANRLQWRCPFVLPRWLDSWWSSFGNGRPSLLAVRREGAVTAVAALMISGDIARVIGDEEVCDHLDIVTAPGAADGALAALRSHLRAQGVGRLDLMRVRPDSTAAVELVPAARRLGLAVELTRRDAAMELALPASWEGYLMMLNGKQRHELRRKLRRLADGAAYRLRLAQGAEETADALRAFLRLFRLNRPDKALFMTPRMEQFFRRLACGLAADGRLRLFSLELEGEAAAVAFCFQHGLRMYLYNNAYDERFRSMSVGLLSKALSIRESIRAGLQEYDFLRGSESYKHHLGARPVPLYGCRIGLA
jgi:CelD/BcsL family acetyltransferase involved in cellulose biosynthesis